MAHTLTHSTPIALIQDLGFDHCAGAFTFEAASRLKRILISSGYLNTDLDEIPAKVLLRLTDDALIEPEREQSDADAHGLHERFTQ